VTNTAILDERTERKAAELLRKVLIIARLHRSDHVTEMTHLVLAVPDLHAAAPDAPALPVVVPVVVPAVAPAVVLAAPVPHVDDQGHPVVVSVLARDPLALGRGRGPVLQAVT